MARTPALLLTCLILLPALALSSTSLTEYPIGFDDLSRESSALDVSCRTPEHTSITLDAPDYRIDEAVVDFETYHLIGVPGEPVLYNEGYPAVPHVTRFYRIPNTGSVELIIREASFTLTDNVNIFPVQREGHEFRSQPVKSADVYGVDTWYPPEVAVVGEPMIMRDFRIVPVTLHPVQVNTATGQARLYDQLDVDLVATGVPGENELLNPRRPSSAFAPLYRHAIRNLDENALDDVEEAPGSYIILCRDNPTVLQWVDTLATWKRRRGFFVTVEARNNWSYSSMYSFLQDAYSNGTHPLEFACIFGDTEGSYSMPTRSSGMSGQYDHYFAKLDGNDELADIGVGRLSVSGQSHMNTVMAKIMLYEREPYMDDTGWFNRAFLYASTGQQISSNEITMLWAKRQFDNLTGINDAYVATHPNFVNETLIRQRLELGALFFLWRGSVIGEMDQGTASVMQPYTTLPVTLTITCGTGDFDYQTSISESWLLAGTASAPKGGVCGIGTATTYTHTPQNNTVAGGLVYAICNLGIEHIGAALAAAKVELMRAFPGRQEATWFSRWNNLIGDPGLSMWTDEPVVLDVAYPGTVYAGARRVTVQVLDDASGAPIRDALVVLWKGEESYTRDFTDGGGFVDVPVTVDSPGTMTLTVTKRNHKPFLADIACVNTSQMVSYNEFTVDDDNGGGTTGNNDGNVNPGEVIDLTVELMNHGLSETAVGISATMTSDNPKVAVLNASSTYPDVAPGDSAMGHSAFRISVDPSMEHTETAKLTLAVNTDQGISYSTFQIECLAGHGTFVESVVTGGDGDPRLEPGETVDLYVRVGNDGALPMESVSAELVSYHSLVSVMDAQGSYDQIPVGSHQINSANPFSVRANSLAFNGTPAQMLIILTTASGTVDSLLFTLPIGIASATDPTGPDDFGYFAYDNVDTDNNGDPLPFVYPYNWLDIRTQGTRLTHASADPGEQQPTGQTNSDLVTLPFNFTFYGDTYNQLTVCSNGWAAFGNQSELDMFRNYPIPAAQVPDAFLAPYWDDMRTDGTPSVNGVWVYHDQANARYIVQWNARGAFNPDRNQDEIFQLLLLDPSVYETDDGSGVVVFQYYDVAPLFGDPGQDGDVRYETVGIQAPGGLIGLPYRFNDSGYPGASSLIIGRTIVFTTDGNVAAGEIEGRVTDYETGIPIQGAEIWIDGEGLLAWTDANGRYSIDNVMTGTYTLRATRFGYNDGVLENFVVEMDSTESGDFALRHPEISLSTERIEVTLPGDPQQASFSIINDGNGPLDYEIETVFARNGTQIDEWKTVDEIALTGITLDNLIQGCVFLGDHWYVSGGVGGVEGENNIYKFDRDGNHVQTFAQPANSHFGWFGLATDGNLIYGSEGRVGQSGELVGINQSGQVQTTIPAPLNPCRAVAYCPLTDHFWVADYASMIYEITRDGSVVHEFPNSLQITGLSWNPADDLGYHLYIFHNSGTTGAHVSRMHPISGDIRYLRELTTTAGGRSGGCCITSDWNSVVNVFGAVIQTPDGDHLEIRRLDFDDDWYDVSPVNASVNAGSSRDVTVAFYPGNLRIGTYEINLLIRNNSLDDLVTLPVLLTSFLPADELPETVPGEYALHQNYPNPFNGTTTIEFDLQRQGPTTLRVYNLLGQEVASLVNDFREAGRHRIALELNNAASGVYLYRLESGDFSQTRKLVLMK